MIRPIRSSFLLACSSSSSLHLSRRTTSALYRAIIAVAPSDSIRLRSHGSKLPLRLSIAHNAPASLPSLPMSGTAAMFRYTPPSPLPEAQGSMASITLPGNPSPGPKLMSTGTMAPRRSISLNTIRPSTRSPTMHTSQSSSSLADRVSARLTVSSSSVDVIWRDDPESRFICSLWRPRALLERCLSALSRKVAMPAEMSPANRASRFTSSSGNDPFSGSNSARTPIARSW